MGVLRNAYQEHVRQKHLLKIENLVRTVCKDGVIKQIELENLHVEGNKYYFSDEELDLMVERQMERNREYFRECTLPDLIKTAARDTIISPNERNLLYSKAKVWNVSEEEVDTYIEQALSERVTTIENSKYAVETAAGIVSAVAGGVGAVFRGIGKLGNKIIDTHIAKQQAQQTNQTNQSGAQQPTVPPVASNNTYLLAIGGQQYGPYSVEQLKAMIPTRQFTDQTLVWKQGMNNWQPANQVQELALLFAPATPPIPQSSDMPPMPPVPPQC